MIEAVPGGIRLRVRVIPRASRFEVQGWTPDGVLRVKLTAPPVDGAANAELLGRLARLAGVKKGAVRLLKGHSGREKQVEIDGVEARAFQDALSSAPGHRKGVNR